MVRTFLIAGCVAGFVFGWLAFDPPAPRHAGANSTFPPTARTGAPGEFLCFDGCHNGGTVNDGVGSVQIGGVPAAYTPGQVYPLTVTVQRTARSRWGFELVALRPDGLSTGTLANTTDFTFIQTGTIRNYIGHTLINAVDGTFSGQTSGTWNFTWEAPAAGEGTVTFYAAGNAANGDATNQGDSIYSTSVSSTEGSTTAVDATTWGRIKMLYR